MLVLALCLVFSGMYSVSRKKIAPFYICCSYVKYWPIFTIFGVAEQEVSSNVTVIYI